MLTPKEVLESDNLPATLLVLLKTKSAPSVVPIKLVAGFVPALPVNPQPEPLPPVAFTTYGLPTVPAPVMVTLVPAVVTPP